MSDDAGWSTWAASLSSAAAQMERERVWAWYVRGLAVMFAWVTFILARQITAIASSEGIFPVKARFERMRADFPFPHRFFYFPSWLHLCHADWLLPSLLFGASGIGLTLVWTGAASRLGLFLMWSVYLSYANVMNFMYPWDCLILEMGFLSLFMPQLHWIGSSWNLTAAPSALLCFSMRYLVWRLMFGFGKFKFQGMKPTDLSYLKGFLINQPIPTVLGWFMHHLPLPIHVASYVFLFLVEIPGPFLYFVCGWPRLLGAALVVLLQVGINLTGTFGYFNALTTVLSIVLLDVNSSLLHDFAWAAETATPAALAQNLFLAFLLLLHCVSIPFNSWCSMAFLHWPALNVPTGAIGNALRLIAPWHVSHAYGVFFPHSSPALKWIPVVEATDAEVIDADATEAEAAAQRAAGAVPASEAVWKEYQYKFMVSSVKDPQPWPRFVAPYHPRVEHAILYESLGLGPQTHLTPVTTGDPYEFQPNHMLGQVCAGLLRQNPHVEDLFRAVPFGRRSSTAQGRSSQPRAVRVSMFLFKPTTPGELLRTGRWWQRLYSHVHIPAMTARQVARGGQGLLRLREPELFHPEFLIWQQRSLPVQRLLVKMQGAGLKAGSKLAAHGAEEAAAIQAAQPPAAVAARSVAPASDATAAAPIYSFMSTLLTEADVAAFWETLVAPMQPDFLALRQGHKATLHPLANGSRHAGLTDSVLLEARNAGFRVDKPADAANPADWSQRLRALWASPAWRGMDRSTLDKHEKVLARLTLLLVTRLLPWYHGPAAEEPTRTVWSDQHGTTPVSARVGCAVPGHLHLHSFYHLTLFAHHIISHGAGAYDATLADPSTAHGYLSSWSIDAGMLLMGAFHGAVLAYQSRKRRMMSVFSHPSAMVAGGVLPGFLGIYYNFLEAQFPPPEGDSALSETFPRLTAPASPCDGWTVDTANMTTLSPGKQAQTQAQAQADGGDRQSGAKRNKGD